MLRWYILGALCVWATHAANKLEEYNRRHDIVNAMNGLYESFINSAIDDVQERNKIQTTFIQYCDNQFDNSHSWIMNALKDPQSSLVTAVLQLKKFNTTKTEMFIKTGFDTAQLATSMGFWCSAVKQDKAQATSLVEFQKTVETEIPGLTTKLKSQMQSIFTGNVTALVQRWATERSFGNNEETHAFMQEAADTLRRDYQVGQWVTVAFGRTEIKKVCYRPGTFFISAPARQDWTLMVFLLRDGQNHDVSAADRALSRIQSGMQAWTCKAEVPHLLKEARYTCNSDQFTFFGAFDKAVFGASDASLFRSKGITRKWAVTTCKYRIGIFA